MSIAVLAKRAPRTRMAYYRVFVSSVVLTVLAICLAFAGNASAKVALWHLHALSMPANLPPGGTGTIVVSASNLGDAEINASKVPVKLIDKLPPSLEATSASGSGGAYGLRGPVECSITPSSRVVECGFEHSSLPEYERLEVEIAVKVASTASLHETNEMTIAGGESYVCGEVASSSGNYTNNLCTVGGAGDFEEQAVGAVAGVNATQQLTVSSKPPSFGVESYELAATNEDGSLDKQAGSHPFGLTTTLDLNRTGTQPYQPAMPKDLRFGLPPGLIGNPTPFPQCPEPLFEQILQFVNKCPGNTAVGVAVVTIRFPGEGQPILTVPVPVFNLKPAVGEPARFGFEIMGDPVTLDTSVRTGEDYGVTVSVDNINQTAAIAHADGNAFPPADSSIPKSPHVRPWVSPRRHRCFHCPHRARGRCKASCRPTRGCRRAVSGRR
jgi:hypothetical protein